MKLRFILLAASAAILAACGAEPATEDYAAFVNPKIGTGGHGHVFVGANVPFGFVQLGPTSIPQSWDWCSGYHDSDRTVIGFSHIVHTIHSDVLNIPSHPEQPRLYRSKG